MNDTAHAPVQAAAETVLAWYRRRLADTMHDLAFTESALAEAQALIGSLAKAQSAPLPDPAGPDFGAWVAQHWPEIEDARLAHAVAHARQEMPGE